MRAEIIIDFDKINGVKVSSWLLETNPTLIHSTEKTISILCEQIEKYFKDKKIETFVEFKVEK